MADAMVGDHVLFGGPQSQTPSDANLIYLIAGAIGLAALAAVVYFDLGAPLAFNDDWVYAWSARHAALDGIPSVPIAVAMATAWVQVVWGVVFSLGHTDNVQLLRLSLVPFLLLGTLSIYRLARSLSADRTWSGIAALIFLTAPMVLHLSTSFMTDVPYLALMLAAAEAGARWVNRGRGKTEFVAWAVFACLQRQIGVAIPLALLIGLIAARRQTRVSRSDLAWAGLALAISLAVDFLPTLAGLANPVQSGQLSQFSSLDLSKIGRSFIYLAPMSGLLLLPFGGGLALAARSRRGLAFSIIAAVLGAVILFKAIDHLGLNGGIYPGDVWTRAGFTPTSIGGLKPPLFSDAVWTLVGLASLANFVVVFMMAAPKWARVASTSGGIFLLTLIAAHALQPVLGLQIFDRYYLPVAVLMIPLVASFVTGSDHQHLAVAWALLVSVTGLGVYVIGQQDYEAWMVARDRAAAIAYQSQPPSEVLTGYESDATHVAIPSYDETGRWEDFGCVGWEFLVAPAGICKLELQYANADDPRPGVTYDSAAPGKIVIVAGR